MNRLDRHVIAVQNKLALGRLLHALAVGGLVLAALIWIAILADRLLHISLAAPWAWFWIGAAAVVVGSLMYAWLRRPSRHDAAVAIDQRLGLKEKFSTALYARSVTDPFAAAAVRDAEQTAVGVSIRRRFPLAFPRIGYGAIAIALAALLTSQFLPQQDLFGRQARHERELREQREIELAKKVVEDAIAQVQAIPRAAADGEAVTLALRDLEEILNQPIRDPGQARRTATRALQDVEDALKQRIRESSNFATAQTDARLYRSMTPPADDRGPVAEAHRAISRGEFSKAINELSEAVQKFDQMDEQSQRQSAEQMAAMAQQLADLANNPGAQQQMQQQLQQLGMNQQQAQQMAQQIQQAARGDQQAQQQLQQQVQNLMQQMNNGQGPTEQQRQQMQQMMSQMQAQANSQAQAEQMAQAAQQLAQAMQQQAAQQPNPQAQQQMAQGQQAMQQQLQQLDAIQQDAAQIAAAQAAAAEAAAAAAGQVGQGGDAGDGGQGEWAANDQQGEWQPHICPQCGGGNCPGGAGCQGGGVGQGQGWGQEGFAGMRDRGMAPAGFRQEISKSQDDEEGKILASFFVKDQSVKGESRVELQQAIAAAQSEATDEVDQERISLQSQRVVRNYFQSMERDLE